MCGITGFISSQLSNRPIDLRGTAERMIKTLYHRGPDDGGIWTDEKGVVLAHRRLAILDLSRAGHQPMKSLSERFVLVFNGEIYNHNKLRKELRDIPWRGYSDTETLLEAFEVWGVEETLKRTVGMFALALWDRRKKMLILARDRFGEKPLFYGWQGQNFVFGSELKSLSAHPDWKGQIDRNALTELVRSGYVPQPMSIWRGVKKLLPGSFLTLRANTNVGELPEPEYYWRSVEAANGLNTGHLDDEAAIDELDSKLRRVVRDQMIADVPLGAFLSGGVDSSTVVAMMQTLSSRPVKTFTVGFEERDYDEAQHARAVAEYLKTDHTELYVSPVDARSIIPRLPEIYDEPFGDVSQIPTHLVSLMAREHVTVSLSGDGGDEVFGGYNRHVLGASYWGLLNKIPARLRALVAKGILKFSPSQWDDCRRFLPRSFRHLTFGERMHKLASVLDAPDSREFYYRLISHERYPEAVVKRPSSDSTEYRSWADLQMDGNTSKNFSERMMLNDQIGYLPDDILSKVDRAAMAASLETRMPFLDHRIFEFAWKLPFHMKIRDGESKWLVRQVLYRYVPKTLIERPKQGFGVPINVWLRGPLRDWAESLIDESRLNHEGYLESGKVRREWDNHLSGDYNRQHWLWNVLMFQAWKERWAS